MLYNIGLLTPSTRKSSNVSFPQPNVEGAKKQSIKRIVDMVAQKIVQSKLAYKQIKHEDIDMVAQKKGQSKLLSKWIKHEDTHTIAVTTNDASRVKIMTQKPGSKQSPE